MRPKTILKSIAGGPFREVAFDLARVAAMLETNRGVADEAALVRHLRRGRPVFMIMAEYRLKPGDTLRLAAA